jgi:hypothetical protein
LKKYTNRENHMYKSTTSAKLLIALVLITASAYAEFPISVGVKGGLGLTDSFRSNEFTQTAPIGFEGSNFFDAGLSVGGGGEFKLMFLRIAPEIRYTRPSRQVGGGGWVGNRNQAEPLFGVCF